jgi:hypothetical protein
VGQANGEVSSSLDSVTTPKITTYEAVARQLRYSHSVGYRRLDTAANRHAARTVEPAADLHPAAGADQGQAHLMRVFQGAVNATVAAFGIDAVYTPAGDESVSVRVTGHDRRLRGDPHPCRDGDLRRAGERGRHPAPRG